MVTSWECRPGLGGAMTTSFPAVSPNNDHTLTVPSTRAEAPQGVQASPGAAAQSFLLGTNFEREKSGRLAVSNRSCTEWAQGPADTVVMFRQPSGYFRSGRHKDPQTPLLLTHLTERPDTEEKTEYEPL